jgi:hypothetical protein
MLTPEMIHIWKRNSHMHQSPLLVETELDIPLNSAHKFLQGCMVDYEKKTNKLSPFLGNKI